MAAVVYNLALYSDFRSFPVRMGRPWPRGAVATSSLRVF